MSPCTFVHVNILIRGEINATHLRKLYSDFYDCNRMSYVMEWICRILNRFLTSVNYKMTDENRIKGCGKSIDVLCKWPCSELVWFFSSRWARWMLLSAVLQLFTPLIALCVQTTGSLSSAALMTQVLTFYLKYSQVRYAAADPLKWCTRDYLRLKKHGKGCVLLGVCWLFLSLFLGKI